MGASLPLCLFILWRHSCPLVKWLKLVCALEICAWSSHSHCRVKRELERRGNMPCNMRYSRLCIKSRKTKRGFFGISDYLHAYKLGSAVFQGQKCFGAVPGSGRLCCGLWKSTRAVKRQAVYFVARKKKKEKKSSPFARNWTRVKFENKLICSKRRLPESPVWLCATRRYFVWFAPCGYRAVLSKGRSLPSPCVKTGARHFNASLLCVVCLSCKSPHGLLYGFRMVTQN